MSTTPPPGGSEIPPQQGGPGGPQPGAGPFGPGGPQIQFRGPPGAPMPTPEQVELMKRKLVEDAQKLGMSLPQYLEHMKRQAIQQQQARMAAGAAGGQPGMMGPGGPGMPPGGLQPRPGAPAGAPPGARPIQPGPPKPEALALAKFLRGQDLKPRTVILKGERKEMFRGMQLFDSFIVALVVALNIFLEFLIYFLRGLVKRALRAMQSPAYEKARKKNPVLPEIKDQKTLEQAFKLLPLSMLALRVDKIDPKKDDHGHDHSKKGKRVKGQWNVAIVPQQDAGEDMYYIWLWEGSQVMRKVYAGLALVVIFLIVLYPLWPLFLRQGVYYLSWGLLLLLGLFFLMAIFRVILFCVTYFVVPPGLWLYPNLWEDVSFMDSFRPVWAWHEVSRLHGSN